MRTPWLPLVVGGAVAMAMAGCGKIEIVGGNNPGADLLGSNNGNNDLTGQQVPFDMIGQPIAAAKATPIDQPTGTGAPVYLPLAGLGVKLESTGSSDPKGQTLSYAWKVVSAPSGSTINDAALMNAATATSGFVPDLGGTYQIELTVTTTDSRLAKASVSVSVQTSALFYLDIGLADMTSIGQTLTSIRSDGSGKKALGCPSFANTALPQSDDNPILFSAFAALNTYRPGYRTPDPVTGIEAAARIVSGAAAFTDMGGIAFLLNVAEEDSSCATKPPKPVMPHAAGLPLAPVWSPDRSRFLYAVMDDAADGAVKLAIATDAETTPITGLTGLTPARVQPAWIDDTHILFVTQAGAGPFMYQIYTAKLDGAVASDVALWADCTSQSANWLVMQGFEYRNGAVYMGVAAEDKQFNGYNVFKIAPPATTTTCNPLNLTQTGPQSSARDFAVSPDGKWMVFSKPEVDTALDMEKGGGGGPPALDLFIMDLTMGTAKKLVGEAGTIEFGPQFIAGGRQIMFYGGPPATLFNDKQDLGEVAYTWKGISVINLDGSNPRALVGGSATSLTNGNSNGPSSFFGPMVGANYLPFGGCGIDPLQTPLSALASAFVLLAAVYLGLRRRRS